MRKLISLELLLKINLVLSLFLNNAWASSQVHWHTCQGINDNQYQCARLTVPLDYNNPHPGNTWVEIIKYQQADSPKDNILFFQGGGPWVEGTQVLPFMVNLLNLANPELLKHFTLVSFDPRGVGQSQNLSCNAPIIKSLIDINYASVAGMNKALQAYPEMAKECAGQFNGFQNFMGTKFIAQDFNQIRKALGADKITYLGYSYGTQLGSLYLSKFPQHIRAMVIDSNITPIHDWQYFVTQAAQSHEKTLNAFFQYCNVNKNCPIYPNAEQVYDQVVAKLTTESVPANPEPLTLAHFYTAVTWSVLQNTSTDPQSITPDEWGNFAEGLKEINEHNDGTIIESLFLQEENITNSLYVTANDMCSDFGDHPSVNQIQQIMSNLRRTTPRIGAYFAGFFLSWCTAFPSEANTLPNLTFPANTPPIIVVGNFDDSITPYLFSQQMQQTIPNSSLLTWTGPGHVTYLGNEMPGTCVQKQIDNYLLNSTPISQPVCDDVINPTSFLIDAKQAGITVLH